MFSGFLTLAAFVASVVLTEIIRRYAYKKSFLDIPNSRSSHDIATPHGGGLAIVISFLLSLAILYWRNSISQQMLFAFWGGGLVVALMGLADDLHHIRASYRILVHFVASGTGLYFLGGIPPVVIGSIIVEPGMVGNLLGIIFLVWLLNLFNFMDGIDGIAASEAIFIAGGAAFIIATTGREGSISSLLLFVAACAGFLVWNWPPAKIFMGDVGSGFLGICLGFFVIETVGSGELSLYTWLILFGVFFIDATVTLLMRIAQGQRWYEAHRSHAYQILSRRLGSHRKVTLLTMTLNVSWLLPLAYLSSRYPERSLSMMIIAFTPILGGVYFIGAGKENKS